VKTDSRNISVIAPCYNEQDNLERFVEEVLKIRNHFQLFELILIDDGSKDESWSIISELVSNHSGLIRGVRLSRNFGHQKAVLAGLSVASFEVLAIIDSDLQDPPSLLPDMTSLLTSDVDMVIGRRTQRAGESWLKLWSASTFYKFINALSEIDIPKNVGDFRVVTSRANQIVLEMNEVSPFLRGQFAFTGLPFKYFDYSRNSRFAGKSNYTFRAMLKLAFSAILSFSTVPIRWLLRIAISTFLLSLTFVFFTVSHYIFYGGTAGWLTTFTAIFMFGSINLLVSSVSLRYISIILETIRNRPKFVISLII
jgi:dolichol-phosphate mannosyltransferase